MGRQSDVVTLAADDNRERQYFVSWMDVGKCGGAASPGWEGPRPRSGCARRHGWRQVRDDGGAGWRKHRAPDGADGRDGGKRAESWMARCRAAHVHGEEQRVRRGEAPVEP